MEPLLGLLAVIDQPAPVPDRGTKRVNSGFLGLAATCTLPGQIGQRSAVTVIGLETTRAQLSPSRLGLRRREQPQRPRMETFELSGPGPMQAPSRLDRE